MSDSQMDVLVDLAPGITVFRQDGKWFWKGRPSTTLEDVLRELSFQGRRLKLRADLVEEALAGLTPPTTPTTPS